VKSAAPVRVWTVPVLLGVATLVGLAVALLEDGAGDVLGGLALGVPIAVVVWCLIPKNQAALRRRTSVGG
jgi:hypothetical protein